MKTTEQIALEVANTITAPYISDESLTRFAEKFLAAWLGQQSQEPVAYMAPSGTCVTAEDVSYTPHWTDYYTIPLYAAPPAKVEQQSQEPVAWMGRDGEDFSYKESSYFTKPLFLAPLSATSEWRPIETAPKDKFLLLAGSSGYTTTPFVYTTGRMCSDYHTRRWIDHVNDDLTDWGFEPSHWMPLPPAPKGKQE